MRIVARSSIAFRSATELIEVIHATEIPDPSILGKQIIATVLCAHSIVEEKRIGSEIDRMLLALRGPWL